MRSIHMVPHVRCAVVAVVVMLAPVQPDGIIEMPSGLVGGREFIPRAEGLGVFRAVDPLVVTDRLAEDAERIRS